ncbi:MAG TPA: adenosylmethionine--8-amino-7-oxononanoate transaminase [Puia sp.]|nr:adenosylmethionine--8-amino-7-oxononanoate transaminase [Puia sp.]
MRHSLSNRDHHAIWHPYTQHKNARPPIAIAKGKGALLYDESGKSYIDAISSWWVTIHGHGHPYIARRIYEQAKKLEHVIFAGFTHEPAVQLAERLLPILPGKLSKIFYSDNGSTAVEVAIKMAIQFWKNQRTFTTLKGQKRRRVLALRHSYHGDTFGSMSISEKGIFIKPFKDYLFNVDFIEAPTPQNIEEILRFIDSVGSQTACFIYEPLLQAAGGMNLIDPLSLDRLLTKIKSKNIICIADEVMTGFYRTGKFFASDYLVQKPDIICLSKGLTGGTMALGITAATEQIFEAFCSDDQWKTFFHGHSFTANPIACTASLASLDLIDTEKSPAKVARIEDRHRDFLSLVKNKKLKFRNARQLGTVLAFETTAKKGGYLAGEGKVINRRALERGIFLRPLGNTVYLMPPYCITDRQLNRIYAFLEEL